MINTEYRKILKLLNKNDALFAEFVTKFPPKNKAQSQALRANIIFLKNPDKVRKMFEPTLDKQIDNLLGKKIKSWQKHGKKLPKLLQIHKNNLSDQVKKKMVNLICSPMQNFYPYAKKDLIEIAAPWVTTESQAIKVIQHHHRIIQAKDLDHLLGLVPKGLEHGNLKKIKNSALFAADELNKLDLNDKDERHKFINKVAQTPSVLKSVNQKVHVTAEDLKKLPPCRRFDFLNFMYYPVIGHWRFKHMKTKKRMEEAMAPRWDRITMDLIPPKEIENLLFSVVLRKHEQVESWYHKYQRYYTVMTAPSKPAASGKKRRKKIVY